MDAEVRAQPKPKFRCRRFGHRFEYVRLITRPEYKPGFDGVGQSEYRCVHCGWRQYRATHVTVC